MTVSPTITGRLAPSPTGELHPGHASSFGLAWLSVRSRGGRLVLRLEDIDDSRSKPGAIGEIERDLEWLGLNWDGPKLVQTTRAEAHQAALEMLKNLEAVYPCTCTRGEIARAASAPQSEDGINPGQPRYPGTCAYRQVADYKNLQAQGTPFTWRLRTPGEGWPSFQDGLRGQVPGALAAPEGDFIVWRAAKGNQSGGPSYQLAVVVDDAFQGVNEIVRGEDLLDSTPRQIRLLNLLGLPVPEYYHVPLVLDPSGRRLAKRAGSRSLAQMRALGIQPEGIIGKLAAIWGLKTDGKPVPAKDLVKEFSWSKIQAARWIWS